LYNVHQQIAGRQNYILTLGLAATIIVSMQIGIRIILCGWITNMSSVCWTYRFWYQLWLCFDRCLQTHGSVFLLGFGGWIQN